jgi:SAM-dependent methyltransferase
MRRLRITTLPVEDHAQMMARPYKKQYYARHEGGSVASARAIAPLITDLVQPKSVIDIGCGVGTWLAAFRECGVQDITGFDGPWVHTDQLYIPPQTFRTMDIDAAETVDRTADLAVCLEVAEHVPACSASRLVRLLTTAAPVILFSAAVPYQGGTHHVNEQWPAYWAKIFREREFVPIDCIRKLIWNNPSVEFWYAQNTILYIDENRIDEHPTLKMLAEPGYPDPLPLVHPTKFLHVAERYRFFEPFLRLVRRGARRIFPRR